MAGRYPSVSENSGNIVSFPAQQEKSEDAFSVEDAKKIAKENRPRGLRNDERRVWDNSMPEFIMAGRFKPLYKDFFFNYCVLVARMARLLDFLNDEENGWRYTSHGRNGIQYKTRPEAAQYNDDWRKWNSMCNQIGMSPATDQRFHGKQSDLFDDNFPV